MWVRYEYDINDNQASHPKRGGGVTPIWPKLVCAAVQSMVSGSLLVLYRVYTGSTISLLRQGSVP